MSDKPNSCEQTFEIVNSLGLHARAAALLVQTAQKYKSQIEIARDDVSVNGKSIMGILMLAASKGSQVTVKTDGDDADDAMAGIGELIRNGFWERG